MKTTSSFLRNVGESYNDFTVTKILEIQELNCILRELTHIPSGAQVLHIENEDPENLFCLSFRTLPYSSNGVAHILEHTVLCGSRKYPVKDPFFAMTRRSLNTFMNALTGTDFTCYPAASQVEKDFYNLFEVYIDAVFHPKLPELSFLQEGHRLEFSTPDDPKSSLEFKGIVFNEMKGALSSADSRLWHSMLEKLLPDTTYSYNSGGDPKDIPSLTYAQLIEFHETYYHPSRCLFFFYGNLPLKRHLDFIAEKALKGVLPTPPIPEIPLQKRFTKPVYAEVPYPAQEMEESSTQPMVAFGFLTTPLKNQEEVLALMLLDSILMDTDASLLQKKLIDSKLCIHAEAYIDADMNEIPYILVCKGCEEKNVEKLQKHIWKSLEEIVAEGISLELIESSLHQLEFSRTEISGDHNPFGLTLFMRAALAKQHGCPPENALTIHTLFDKLLKDAKEPSYLPGLIKKYFLENPHFVRLVMLPDPNLATKELGEEKKLLEDIQSKLSEKDAENIIKQTEELEKYQIQTQNQDIDCLPKIDLKDVPVYGRHFSLSQHKNETLEVFHHDCFTNQILYADLIFSLPDIAEEDLSYLQLFISLLPELGVGKRDYEENLSYVHAHTGGISAFTSTYPLVIDSRKMAPALHIRGKSLYRNVDKFFSLLKETVTSLRCDEEERIEELLMQLYTMLEDKLNRNALKYAVQVAFSGQSVTGKIFNSWYGLDYFTFLRDITNNLDTSLPKVIEKFSFLREQLLCLEKPHLVLSCDQEMYKALEREHFYGLLDLPQKKYTPWKGDYKLPIVASQLRPISAPVAFNVQAMQTIGYIHPESPTLSVATHLFENTILHHEIREKGGAYGAGTSYSPTTGKFYLFSYRDPHIVRSLEIFQNSATAISKEKFTEKDVEEAKLNAIQQLDTPTNPGNRAIAAYTWMREGKTKEMRQEYREKILSVSGKEIAKVVNKEILSKLPESIIVSFAGKDLITRENAKLAKENKAFPVISL
ncbi:MAG: metalloprotease [Chlamydiae bacterium]|nr:metalloprotease [Chlamydiota bacterium]